jgi:hypothetical protein
MEIKSDFFHFQMNEGDELQILVKKRKKENLLICLNPLMLLNL